MDPIILMVTMLIAGQVCLSVPLLLVRSVTNKPSLPLAIFLFANGALALLPIVSEELTNWYPIYMAFTFSLLFLLGPSLWLYVEGITSNKHWSLTKKHLRQYVLLVPAIVTSILILLLSDNAFSALFIEGTDVKDPFSVSVAIAILITTLLWVGQCIYLVIRIVHRLISYREQLKQLFSNHDDRSLVWMNWLLFIIVGTWLFFLATLFSSSLFNNALFGLRIEAVLSLLLIWSLAHFGLQQKPGLSEEDTYFEKRDIESSQSDLNLSDASTGDTNVTDSPSAEVKVAQLSAESDKKYQRSALSEEQANRIANKISDVMKSERLYLDANLSLQKLSSHLAISPNYISQTLNETLKVNFFDFVNQWRVEAAKPLIIANQDTVLNIALDVGFNARSSFYKAFKQATGKTPSEFRKNGMLTS